MIEDFTSSNNQILFAASFDQLVATPFNGPNNAVCWKRELTGDFAEVVNAIQLTGNITTVGEEMLNELKLSEQGQIARDFILEDYRLLKIHGTQPTLNIIKYYDRDDEHPFFSTDVYSFHVDRSPIPTDTFLCTYYGAASEILSQAQSEQKILVPELRNELRKIYTGEEENFEAFLSEHFFDLHYSAKPGAQVINLGVGNLWRLAVEYPQSSALPCIHRAPKELDGQPRLLMIC